MSYPSTVLATGGITRYWRFNDASGPGTAAESVTGVDTLTTRAGITTSSLTGIREDSDKSFAFLGINTAYVGNNVIAAINSLTTPVYEFMFLLSSSSPNKAIFVHGSWSDTDAHGSLDDIGGIWTFKAIRNSDSATLTQTIAENNANIRTTSWNHIVYDPCRGRVMWNGAIVCDNYNSDTVKTGSVALLIGAMKEAEAGPIDRAWASNIAEFAVYNGTLAPWNSQSTWDSIALAHFVAMHAIYDGAIIGGSVNTGPVSLEHIPSHRDRFDANVNTVMLTQVSPSHMERFDGVAPTIPGVMLIPTHRYRYSGDIDAQTAALVIAGVPYRIAAAIYTENPIFLSPSHRYRYSGYVQTETTSTHAGGVKMVYPKMPVIVKVVGTSLLGGSTPIFEIRQGDTLPILVLDVQTSDGVAVDLTMVDSVLLTVHSLHNRSILINQQPMSLTATPGRIQYIFTTTNTVSFPGNLGMLVPTENDFSIFINPA